MAVRIANLKILVSANTRGLVGGLTKAGTSVKRFGTRTLSALTSVKSLAVGLVGFVAVAATARLAVRQLATQFGELDKLAKTASKIGVGVDGLQKMRFAAKLAGVEITTTDMALQRFIRRTAEAAVGTGEAQGAFEELRIDAAAFSKLSLEDQMKELADAMGRFSDNDQLRLAFKLFDSEGAALVNTLKGGSAALDSIFKERAELGIFTAEQLTRIESANDNIARFGIQLNFIKGSIAAELAPILDQLVFDLIEVGKEGEFSFGVIADTLEQAAKDGALAVDVITMLITKIDELTNAGKGFRAMFGLAGLAVEFRDQLRDVGVAITDDFGTPALDRVNRFFDDVDERIKSTRERAQRDRVGFGDFDPGGSAGGISALLPQARLQGSAAAASFSAKRDAQGTALNRIAKANEDQLEALDQANGHLIRLIESGKLKVAPL